MTDPDSCRLDGSGRPRCNRIVPRRRRVRGASNCCHPCRAGRWISRCGRRIGRIKGYGHGEWPETLLGGGRGCWVPNSNLDIFVGCGIERHALHARRHRRGRRDSGQSQCRCSSDQGAKTSVQFQNIISLIEFAKVRRTERYESTFASGSAARRGATTGRHRVFRVANDDERNVQTQFELGKFRFTS